MTARRPDSVSVVLVNFRGIDDTLNAVGELEKINWPADLLEIVVVDNASGDGSVDALRSLGDRIVLVEAQTNLGFAGGCNLGVTNSKGEFVAFLNNDARPDSQWVAAAVDAFAQSDRIGAIASRVLDWTGELVDYVGAALTWYGMGYKPFTSERFLGAMPEPEDVLFATGAGMFVRRSVYDAVGGFDDEFFMFFEDVDLGWRINLLGWRVAYVPQSTVYHKHHASMGGYAAFREQYLLERNALYTLYKNLDDSSLARILPAALMLATRRAIVQGGVDSTSLDLRSADDESSEIRVPRSALTSTFAIDQFVEHLPTMIRSRRRVQSARTVSDAALWPLFGSTDVPAMTDTRYLEGYENIVNAFDVLSSPPATRVLIITGDPIGRRLAGPAIRAWNMAMELSKHTSVTLMSLAGVEELRAPFELVHVRPRDERAFSRWEKEADVIVFQGHAMQVFDSLHATQKIVVVDIYDPMHLEQLEQARGLPRSIWERQVADATEILNAQLLRGDFFLCASERQKHFYLGQLAALGRLNPATYENDPHLDALIAVVPFGLAERPPQHERQVLKGVVPGIGPDTKVLIWGGGLYNWFDPITLIRAVARLAESRPEVRLFFQGTAHPHPGVPEMAIVTESKAVAFELGVLDRVVFFHDSWVEYDDRGNYLTEADAGVSTHLSHIETVFSFRTRILDYLWAELPMVVTEGDHFAELVQREGLGVVVPPGDVEALTDALQTILFDEDFVERARREITRVRSRYLWPTVLAPLVEFVADARPAPDRLSTGTRRGDRSRRTGGATLRRRRRGPVHDIGLVAHYLRNGGPRLVLAKIRRRLKGA